MNSLTFFQNINSDIISILNRVLSVELAIACLVRSATRLLALQSNPWQNKRISHHHGNPFRRVAMVAASACALTVLP